jgi:hypothetical protein
MRWVPATALLLALAACGGGGADAVDYGAWDVAASDVPLLADAVLLEPGGLQDAARSDLPASDIGVADPGPSDMAAPADGAASDPGSWWDTPADAASDPGIPFADLPAGDTPQKHDAPPPGDLPVGGDNGFIGPPCGPGGEPCGPGQACVTNTDGESSCAPLGECSGKGAIDLGELVSLLLSGGGDLHVKVMAMPWAGRPSCTLQPCPSDRPCCNTCFAPLFIGAEGFPIALMGQGVAVGCQGNECDVLDLCRPFDQGAWYWVWGVASIMGGKAQFLVEGYCPTALEDALPF